MKKVFIIFSLFLVTSSQAQITVWNLKSFDAAKTSNSELLKSIVRNAEKELTHAIKTVVDKEMTAQSGDKHDYMSLSRYWWPDTTKIDGLTYIRKDGISNPEIEKLDRYPLGDFSKSVQSLSLAYYITSDEKFAEKAVENLRTWFINSKTKMNPNMNYGQTVPGIRNGLGRGVGIIDTYTFIEMLDGVELLKKSKSFTLADQQAIKEWFTAYVQWLQTSPVAREELEAPNNHGTAYDVQLTRYAIFIGNEDLAKKLLNEFPQKRLFSQIEPDGSQPLELARTTALGYSTFNLTHFLDMCQIGKLVGVDLLSAKSTDGRSILKAIDFLVPYINKPASQFPYQQIKDWDGVQEKLCWQLYRVDQMLPKPAYKKYYSKNLDLGKKNIDAILY
ncbi:MAG: alginate lyase family protein [Chitinophagaceae bacterium]|nr:alginate lyase family protein [Chitinophagaceae bacterium]